MVLCQVSKIFNQKILQNTIQNQRIVGNIHGINKPPLLNKNLINFAELPCRYKSTINWCKTSRKKCPEPPEHHPICKKECDDAPPRQDDLVKDWPKKVKQRTWIYCREPCPVKVHTCLDDPPPCVCIDPKYESYFKKPPCW